MRILLVSVDDSKRLAVGGKHIHQNLLMDALEKQHHTVDFLAPLGDGSSGQHSLAIRALRKLGRSLGLLPARHEAFFDELETHAEDLSGRVQASLKAHEYDLISAQDPVALLAVKRAIHSGVRRPRIAMTLHGYFGLESVNYNYVPKTARDAFLGRCKEMEREAASFADCIIAVDTRIRKYILKEISPEADVRILFNAIDDENFRPVTQAEKEKARDQLNLARDGRPVILITRRMVLKNGVVYALQCAERLQQVHALRATFLVLGDGPERKNLRRFAGEHRLEDVIFRGEVSHEKVIPYYSAADFMLVPSTLSDGVEEATSLSMLEGMSSGLVVVATGVGGLKEVIQSGRTGILVADRDYQAMADTIARLWADPEQRNRIASEAAEYAAKHHGYVQHSKEFLRLAMS